MFQRGPNPDQRLNNRNPIQRRKIHLRPLGSLVYPAGRFAFLAAIFATLMFSCAAVRFTETGNPSAMPQVKPPTSIPKPVPESPAPDASAERSLVSSDNTFLIAYQVNPGTELYYIVENEFRDSGAVPGWLSYSTTVKDKRTIIQRVAKASSQPARLSTSSASNVEVTWEIDRFEVREKGLKSEVVFDSLRDSYPPPSLRELGVVPNSRCTFLLDPRTGNTQSLKVLPGTITAPPTMRKASRTALRSSVNEKNIAELLYDLGPQFLPPRAKAVGEEWSLEKSESIEPFGAALQTVTCTLRSVQEREGRKIANIDIKGKFTLKRELPAEEPAAKAQSSSSLPSPGPEDEYPVTEKTSSKPALAPSTQRAKAAAASLTSRASSPPTSRPTNHTPSTPNPAPRIFELDVSVCTGTVEFDVTRGELVRLVLRKEISGATKLEKTSDDPLVPTEIRTGVFHELRVEASRTPPVKPVIVGGPKPPVLPPDEVNDYRPITPPTPATTMASQPAIRPATMPAGRLIVREPSKPQVLTTTRPAKIHSPATTMPTSYRVLTPQQISAKMATSSSSKSPQPISTITPSRVTTTNKTAAGIAQKTDGRLAAPTTKPALKLTSQPTTRPAVNRLPATRPASVPTTRPVPANKKS